MVYSEFLLSSKAGCVSPDYKLWRSSLFNNDDASQGTVSALLLKHPDQEEQNLFKDH